MELLPINAKDPVLCTARAAVIDQSQRPARGAFGRFLKVRRLVRVAVWIPVPLVRAACGSRYGCRC